MPETHIAPADQPTSVSQITALLFPAYTVDGGRVSLAGCALEDRLVLQLGYTHLGQRLEIYLNAEGKEVDGEPVARDHPVTAMAVDAPSDWRAAELERLIADGNRLAEDRASGGTLPELIEVKAIWCKYVEGKLRFTIGAATSDLPFSGWTRHLAPPPFICPYTNAASFHLATTDDGRIAAAEQIELCAATARRMLSTELLQCTVTGRRVAPELIETCPIGGQRLLRSELIRCKTCRQRVGPQAIERGQCRVCWRLKRIAKADPRMARLLHEHPSLDRWRSWRMGESSRVYVLVASGWLKRLLVVVDKETLEFRHMALGSRFSPRWQAADPSQYSYILQE